MRVCVVVELTVRVAVLVVALVAVVVTVARVVAVAGTTAVTVARAVTVGVTVSHVVGVTVTVARACPPVGSGVGSAATIDTSGGITGATVPGPPPLEHPATTATAPTMTTKVRMIRTVGRAPGGGQQFLP